jgi:toxin ParE1/3/4
VAEIVWTAAVERDLIEIGDMIAADNPRLAVDFVEDVRRHCLLLASTPLMGRPRPDLGSDLHSFPHRRYVVFYRYLEKLDRVEILRIWHGRRRTPGSADLGVSERPRDD